MACNCRKQGIKGYLWTSADGSRQVQKQTEIEARAMVVREGGSYAAVR